MRAAVAPLMAVMATAQGSWRGSGRAREELCGAAAATARLLGLLLLSTHRHRRCLVRCSAVSEADTGRTARRRRWRGPGWAYAERFNLRGSSVQLRS